MNVRQESLEVKLRKFNREVQLSQILTDVKDRRFFSKKPSRLLLREKAVRLQAHRKIRRGY